MGQLRERMEQDLRLKNFSPATRKVYLCYARKFAAHFRRSPAEMGETEVREFLLHALQIEQVSYETYRQILAALKFLYTVTLEREWEVKRIPFPKRGPRRLPRAPDRDQVLAIVPRLRQARHRGGATRTARRERQDHAPSTGLQRPQASTQNGTSVGQASARGLFQPADVR